MTDDQLAVLNDLVKSQRMVLSKLGPKEALDDLARLKEKLDKENTERECLKQREAQEQALAPFKTGLPQAIPVPKPLCFKKP